MKTGFKGTFVISWKQTELDGNRAAPFERLEVGTNWRWTGEAVCMDTSQGPLRLGDAEGAADTRKCAARAVRRLVGAAVGARTLHDSAVAEDIPDDHDQGFVLTDGRKTYTATLILAPETTALLLMFLDEMPPQQTDLWVVRKLREPGLEQVDPPSANDVVCLTPGAIIRTENGNLPIEALRPGDRVLTRDDGPQEILWTGQRRMTGARLYAMPSLRPIRFRAGALGIDRPDADLLVSPHHRMLIRGRAAQSLFNRAEVLVCARDLVNNRSIAVDRALREVTYMHLMFERHQVIWANGLETESFHPASTSMEMVEESQQAALLAMFPQIVLAPQSYGDYARRTLSASEAAILRHDGKILAA